MDQRSHFDALENVWKESPVFIREVVLEELLERPLGQEDLLRNALPESLQ
jgi:hypothetical protein